MYIRSIPYYISTVSVTVHRCTGTYVVYFHKGQIKAKYGTGPAVAAALDHVIAEIIANRHQLIGNWLQHFPLTAGNSFPNEALADPSAPARPG